MRFSPCLHQTHVVILGGLWHSYVESRMLFWVPRWENKFHDAPLHRGESREWKLSYQSKAEIVSLLRDSCLTERKKTTAGERLSAKGNLEDLKQILW